MKIKRPSICMKIKGISNLIHQELGTNRDTVHPGTMMQKMFLGYLEVHEDQPVFQRTWSQHFISGAARQPAYCRLWCGTD